MMRSGKRERKGATSRNRRGRFELLERRDLLATDFSGIISSNTVWNSDINLTGDVFVRAGARLTIQSGVNVTAASTIYDLNVSDDASGSSLVANNANLAIRVLMNESATGSVTGNTITAAFTINGTASSQLVFSGNTVNANPRVHAEFIPRLASNTFSTSTTVDTFGIVDANTSWPDLVNVDRYQFVADVFVRGASTLTLANGVTISSASFLHVLTVSDDASGATLVADGVTIQSYEVILGETALGRITGSIVSGTVAISGTKTSTFDFSGNTVNMTPRVHAEYVPRIANNTFNASVRVDVFGIIDTDTIWPNVVNLAGYRLVENVFVHGASVLTLQTGTTVSSRSFQYDLYISDDGSGASLIADGVNMHSEELYLHQTAKGSLTGSAISSILDIAGTAASTFILTGNSINTTPRVDAEFVPSISNNSFDAVSTIGVRGIIDTDIVWPNIPNVSQYQLIGDVFVRNSSVLTLDPGITVTSLSFQSDLSISDDGSGASLIASGVNLGADETFFFESARGSLTGSTISGIVIISGTANSTFTFSNNTIQATPRVHAEYVPLLSNNSFAAASTVEVFGIVDVNTEWQSLKNVDQYRLINDVYVRNSSTLTIQNGNTVDSLSFTSDLFVSDDASGAALVANHVNLLVDEVLIHASAAGRVANSVIGGIIEIAGTESSTFAFTSNTINTTPRIHVEYAPRLIQSSFVGTELMDVFGNIDSAVVWPELPGLSQYRMIGDVRVTGVGSLEISRHVEVISAQSTHFLFIGDPASVARLEVVGATLGMTVVVFGTSQMTSRFTTYTSTSSLRINADAVVDIHFNDFSTVSPDAVKAEGDVAKTIDLTNNWWGTLVPLEIEAKILHQPDDGARPLVSFDPFLLHPLRVPDYVPTQLDVVGQPPFVAGSNFEVTFDISNISLTGEGGAQTAALFYLNANHSQNGSELLEFVAVENLAANTSTGPKSAILTLPDPSNAIWSLGLPASYTLSMLVDASNVVDEFVETNNTISTSISVAPQVVTVIETSGDSEVSEGGAGDSIMLALSAVPSADVTVTVAPDDQLDLGLGVGQTIVLTFNPSTALIAQPISVNAADDTVIEGPHTGLITYSVASTDANFNHGTVKSTAISVLDNDSVKISETIINHTQFQRSSIDSIEVAFNTVVELSSGALELINVTTNQTIPISFGSSQVVSGHTVASLNFDATLITDGNYQLRIPSSMVSAGGISLDGNGDGTPNSDFVDAFYRFYGDTDGDRDVDGQDYGRFGLSFLKRVGDEGFNPAFDSDHDGDVDGQDYGRFGRQLLKSLPA